MDCAENCRRNAVEKERNLVQHSESLGTESEINNCPLSSFICYFFLRLKRCLHGGGGPREGEVTRPAGAAK